MKRVIRHLRNQSEEVRMQILYILTVASALVLFILWVSSFGVDTSDPVKADNTKEALAPFSILKDNVVEGARNLETPW